MLSQLKEIPAYKVGSYIFRRLLQHKVIYVLYKGTAPNLRGFYKARSKLRKHRCCWHEQCDHWQLGCEQIY